MDNLKNSVLIVGGAGFLGSHLIEGLIDNYNLIVLDVYEEYPTGVLAINTDFVYLCVNLIHLEEIFEKYSIDIIINCAVSYGKGISLSTLIQSNVVAPLNLLETAIKKGKLCAYLNTDSFFNNPQNTKYNYLQNYTFTKQFLEKSLHAYTDKIKIINFKIEHMYGTRDNRDKFVPTIIQQLLINKNEIPLTLGDQIRDFIFVKDVVAAYQVVIENLSKLDSMFYTIEVGNGVPVAIKDFVVEASRLSESYSLLNFGVLEYREGEIQYSVADNSMLKELGWAPKYHLECGLRETINYEKTRLNGQS